MTSLYFARRNRKEILREPISLILGILLPVLFIYLFSMVARNAPYDLFLPANIVPGITIFGLTFITMLLALLISKDKQTAFITRLFISPLTPGNFITGYTIPMFPFALLIILACMITGVFVGLPVNINILTATLSYIPYILFSVFLGIFLGITCSETKVMAIGNIYLIVGSILGGAWMDLNILGPTMKRITDFLPFSHAVNAARFFLGGRTDSPWPHLLIVTAYAVVFFILAVIFFRRKMRSDKQ